MPLRQAIPLLALVLAACGSEQRARAAAADSAAPRVDPATANGQVALALWQLRDGVTFDGWMETHAGEVPEARTAESGREHLGPWCARVTQSWAGQSRSVERAAYFYPPQPPEGGALPPDSLPPATLRRSCLLGLIGAELPANDTADGARLRDSVQATLSRVMGEGRRERAPHFYGSAFWSGPRTWRRGTATVATALVNPPRTPADTAPRPRVVAFGFLPASGLSLDPPPADPRADGGVIDTLPLDSAARRSGLPTVLWDGLRHQLTSTASPPGPGAVHPLELVELVTPLRAWLAAAAALPNERRAAALFVADAVIERSVCAFRVCGEGDGAALRPLRALGATFDQQPHEGWLYTRSLLAQARMLARDTPEGNAALLIQLGMAMDPAGTCAAGRDGYNRVIATGERYLARVPASPVAAAVHYYLGEAYRDRAVVADSGAAQDSARAAAVRHFRAAISAAPGTPLARRAWERGWWLLAALPARDTRFACD